MRAALLALFLIGCTTVTVRAPPCELKPLPAAADVVCDKPAPIPDGKLQTLYLERFIANAQYDACIKRFNNYRAQAEARDRSFERSLLYK